MTLEVTVESDDIISEETFSEIKVAAQDAMAIAFSDITLQNFGDSGLARPSEWSPLKEKYAIDYHEGDQTPRLILNGDLRSSIDVELGTPEYSSCFTDIEYAISQQFGDPSKNLPPRPFMPVVGTEDDFELTDFAKDACLAAAENAILEHLGQ